MTHLRNPEANPRRERPTVNRINRIARHVQARTYLEVGVARGNTFHALSFERQVAVDPSFRFDVAEHRRDGVEFHEVSSDAYFTQIAKRETFDIVFLDGLHVFAQTFRDFCNSLAFAHDRTVWIVDDVLPTDVYSAWPSHEEAVRYRREAGGDSYAWHGDVFKVVFAIHDLFPMFTYVTLGEAEDAQTLLWKAPRKDFAPVFNSLERIERLTYFDFRRHRQVLKAMPEEEGLKLFFDSVPSTAQP